MPTSVPAPAAPLFRTALALLLGLPIAAASAGTFTWDNNVTGNWSVGTNWAGDLAPTGTDVTDILQFGGDVGTVAGVAPNYTTREDLAGAPFVLNQLVLNATDNAVSGLAQRMVVTGGGLGLRLVANGGIGPQITQNGAGGFNLDLPIELTAPLTLAGNGAGVVTMNFALSGAHDIVKSGTSTFRFGTPFSSTTIPVTGPSANTWMGRLTINDGTIRFNNNADSGRTALRANPVTLNSGTAQLTCTSELRFGTLNGSAGNVQTIVPVSAASESIVIHALTDGTYGGTLQIGWATGAVTGNNDGALVVRGAAKQTLTGTLSLNTDVAAAARGADIFVGRGATLALAGAASLGLDTRGSVTLSGGTFQLDNVGTNNTDRLRNGLATSTGVDTTGGGTFQLIGNAAGTTETIGRLQLSGGSANTVRSGALTVGVVQNGGATALTMSSYNRLTTANPFTTVDFTGSGGTLGAGAGGPRILFGLAPAVATFNGLFGNTDAAPIGSSVGWATVDGAHFASYGANGVVAVATTPFTGANNATVNAALTDSATVAVSFSQNSLRIAPINPGQSLTITGGGNLDTTGLLLAGAHDYSITGTGGLAGQNTRYVHVQQAVLALGLNTGAAPFPLVKSGAGTLALTGTGNITATSTTAINAGALRANPARTLPGGELQFRGGVLEIVGGTFTRALGAGVGKVNWSGVVGVSKIGEDQGSGGFAAFGADATVTLGGSNATLYSWEDASFVNSGHALLFGSAKGDRRVTFTNPISLSAVGGTVNYNAREIRAVHNPAAVDDTVVLSGSLSGTLQNDLLKTGNGTLALTGANTYLGATLVQEGTLLVNGAGTIATSFLADVRAGATLGGNGTTGAVQVGSAANLSPGDTAGHTSVLATGELKFIGGTSKFVLEIGGTAVGGNGITGYDQVNVTGGITLNGATLDGSLLNGFNPAADTLFFILRNDGSDTVGGTFAQGALVTFGGKTFDISYSGNAEVGTPTFTGGNDVVLRVVPEPSSLALAAGGLALLGWRRRARATRTSQSPA